MARRAAADAPAASPGWALDAEADLEDDLILADLAVFDVSPHFRHFEPGDVIEGLRRRGDGVVDRIGDAVRRRADELDLLVDAVRHDPLPLSLCRCKSLTDGDGGGRDQSRSAPSSRGAERRGDPDWIRCARKDPT